MSVQSTDHPSVHLFGSASNVRPSVLVSTRIVGLRLRLSACDCFISIRYLGLFMSRSVVVAIAAIAAIVFTMQYGDNVDSSGGGAGDDDDGGGGVSAADVEVESKP